MGLITDYFHFFTLLELTTPPPHLLTTIYRKADTALVSGQEAVLANKKGQATLLLIASELPHFVLVTFLFPD